MVGTVSGSGQDSKQCDISDMSLAFRVLIIGQQIFLAKIEWFYSSDDISSMAIGDDWKPYRQSVLFPPVSFILSFPDLTTPICAAFLKEWVKTSSSLQIWWTISIPNLSMVKLAFLAFFPH